MEKAFAAARSAKPGDVFVVYLASHGVALPGDSDQYCYLTSDARTADPAVLNDPAVASQYSITGADLTEWIKKVPALKQVMVLDTCAAGAVAKKLTEQRSVSGEQIRAHRTSQGPHRLPHPHGLRFRQSQLRGDAVQPGTADACIAQSHAGRDAARKTNTSMWARCSNTPPMKCLVWRRTSAAFKSR
ncbi:MAG: caspase family protein [Gemmataceae bacterium]